MRFEPPLSNILGEWFRNRHENTPIKSSPSESKEFADNMNKEISPFIKGMFGPISFIHTKKIKKMETKQKSSNKQKLKISTYFYFRTLFHLHIYSL